MWLVDCSFLWRCEYIRLEDWIFHELKCNWCSSVHLDVYFCAPLLLFNICSGNMAFCRFKIHHQERDILSPGKSSSYNHYFLWFKKISLSVYMTKQMHHRIHSFRYLIKWLQMRLRDNSYEHSVMHQLSWAFSFHPHRHFLRIISMYVLKIV